MLATSHFELNSLNDFFNQAIDMNNAGVNFYKLGKYEVTIQCLRNALIGMQQFSARQGASRDSVEQTILESLTSYYSHDSMVAPALNQYTTFPQGYREVSEFIPSSDSFNGDEARLRGRVEGYESRCSPFILPDITDECNAYSVGNSCCQMDLSSNGNHANVANPIDANAIYRFALNLVCRGDCAEAIVNPAASCSRKDAARIRASILFNLGLVFHMVAVEASSFAAVHRGPESLGHPLEAIVRPLETAKTCYQLSLKLQESEKAPISNHILMAICNNIGQCYAALHRYSDSIAWAERLLRLLVCSQQRVEYKHKSQPGHECFIRNTSSLILRDPYVAPMA